MRCFEMIARGRAAGRALLLLAIPCCCAAGSSSSNGVVNGAFDRGLAHWQANAPTGALYTVVEGAAHLQHGPAGYHRIYQDVPVASGMIYRLRYRQRIATNGSGRAWVYQHDRAANRWMETIQFGPTRQSNEWETVSLLVNTRDTTDQVRLSFGSEIGGTLLLIDDVVLEALESLPPSVDVPATTAAITLDGRPDEPAWQQAAVLGDFRVLGEPLIAATPATEVRLLVQGDALYVSFRATEPHLNRLTEQGRTPAMSLHADDSAQLFFSSDGQSSQQFIVNSRGVGFVVERGKLPDRQNWHHAAPQRIGTNDWEAQAARDRDSWSLELRIDLHALMAYAPTGSSTLLANFCRHRPQQEPIHANWARMSGATFIDPRQYRPLQLPWRLPTASPQAGRDLTVTRQWQPPERLLAGNPVLLTPQAGTLPLPAAVTFATPAAWPLDTDVQALLARGIAPTNGQGALTVRCTLWKRERPGFPLPVKPNREQRERLRDPEAFALRIAPDGVTVAGRSREGILRGLATLALLASHTRNQGYAELPALTLLDAPRLSVRGWLLAPAGLEDLKRQIDILYLLRGNTVMFGVSGFGRDAVFPFDSHPNIGSRASTKAQWAEMADYARARGLNPVPEFYCFARAGFILNKPAYAHLAENPGTPRGTYTGNSHDKNFCSSNPESVRLGLDLLGELVDTLKLTDLQIGMDEIFYDTLNTCPTCVSNHVSRSDWLVRFATASRDYLAARNVRTWMYADCLDPEQNGRQFEQSGPEMLARLPRDLVLQDWKYSEESYPSLGLFARNGFAVIGSPWHLPYNVAGLAREVAAAGGRGLIGTSWSGTTPSLVTPEIVTAQSLGAFCGWSPLENLAEMPYIPAALYQEAAFRYGQSRPTAGAVRPLALPTAACSGSDLAAALGFAPGDRLTFLREPIRDDRGRSLQPFARDGQPAGLVVKGKSGAVARLPLSGRARGLTLLHAVNRQPFEDEYKGEIGRMRLEYAGVVPATLVLRYADGTMATLPLVPRRTINAWNDRSPAAETLPGFFGTVGKVYHVNLPLLFWALPHPEKELLALELQAGNREAMDVVLLGAWLEGGE